MAQVKVSKGNVFYDGVEIGSIFKSEDFGWGSNYMQEETTFWYSQRKLAVNSLVSLYEWCMENPDAE